MLAIVNTLVITGIEAKAVKVEVDLMRALPGFEIVGLASVSIREARERVKSAIKNCGLEFPNKKIIVNLAPADLKKEGSHFDLAIAAGILAASGQIDPLPTHYYLAGELSLDGTVRKVPGILPMALELAATEPDAVFIVPEENSKEAALVDEITSYTSASLMELYTCLSDHSSLRSVGTFDPNKYSNVDSMADFSEVKGQESAKRALQIAAAGLHNALLIGPPGGGKTMLARRVPGILPEMTREEILETSRIYSVAGLLDTANPLIVNRPFRSPHKNASSASIIGGGKIPRPGEISLAQNGVLFMDELPEFSRDVLEALRQPLEDKIVTVARAQATYTFPANFSLITSMNPCSCSTEVQETCFKVEVEINDKLPEETMGQRLRKARKQKDLLLSEVADEAGISKETLRNWETGKTKSPYGIGLKKVADYLGVKMEYLLGPLPKDATLAQKLVYYRWCHGLNQKQMAKIIGMDPTTLSDAERGKQTPYIMKRIPIKS